MKAILFHCKEYTANIRSMPRNPEKTAEDVVEEELKCEKCIVVWITVEDGDDEDRVPSAIAEDIEKMSSEVGTKDIIVFPFAHLSNNLASPKEGLKLMKIIEEKLKDKLNVSRGHFGSNKEIQAHIYGHPGNARYREY